MELLDPSPMKGHYYIVEYFVVLHRNYPALSQSVLKMHEALNHICRSSLKSAGETKLNILAQSNIRCEYLLKIQ